MVLAERNTTDVVRNGRRSRGPSPNTHATGPGGGTAIVNNAGGGAGAGGAAAGVLGVNSTNASNNEKASNATATGPGAGTPESSDDDNSTKRNGKSKAKQSEYEEKIRVGRDYQAVCPPLIPEPERRPEMMNERALLVWSPTKEIPDLKLEEYISVAKEKYGYNGEQALGMLFWHKHDLERAVMDLANFTPFPDEWTIEDKVLFEQAFQFHGKSFHRIRQMLPDKSIASLVKYYYSWKKTRHRSSAMDRQEKAIKMAVKEGSENGSEVGSNEESDNDDKKANNNNTTTSNNNNNNNSNASNTTANNNASSTANNNNVSGGIDNGGNSSSSNNNNNSSNSNNNNNHGGNELDIEQICIFSATNPEEVLGFGVPDSTTVITTNGNAAATTGSGGDSSSDSTGMANLRRATVGGFCKNCNVVCYILYDSPLGHMCNSCHTHWRRTGNRRPISGPECFVTKRSAHNSSAVGSVDRSKRKPPKGMYINHDDLIALASSKDSTEYLGEGERKIAALMAEIQKNRQVIEQQKKDCDAINIDAAIEMVKTNAEAPPPRVSARWTPEETQMATSALRDYGKNYAIIARLVATKNEAHVRTFYLNNRRRLNLDNIVKEYEAMVASKSEEAAAEESTDAAAASATAAAAADATDTASVVGAAATAKLAPTENSDNSSSPSNSNGSVTQDNQTKKEEPAAAALNTAKKKSDTAALAPTAASTIKSTENAAIAATNTLNSTKLGVPTVGTAANSAAIGNSIAINNSSNTATATKGGSNNKSTIMIGDESDTATNSSSDVATNNTAATGTSSASSASVPAKSSGSNPSERDSEASSTIKPSSGTASNKREATEMPEDEQTPAKKISLSNPTETLGK